MKKLVLVAIAGALLSLPALVSAQNCLQDVGTPIEPKGEASLTPALTGTPRTGVTLNAYTFFVSPVTGVGPVAACGRVENTGNFRPGASCSGNAHYGTIPPTTPTGQPNNAFGVPISYNGVCAGTTCEGVATTTSGVGVFTYQLDFSVATAQAALAACGGSGLASATFGGAFAGRKQ